MTFKDWPKKLYVYGMPYKYRDYNGCYKLCEPLDENNPEWKPIDDSEFDLLDVRIKLDGIWRFTIKHVAQKQDSLIFSYISRGILPTGDWGSIFVSDQPSVQGWLKTYGDHVIYSFGIIGLCYITVDFFSPPLQLT